MQKKNLESLAQVKRLRDLVADLGAIAANCPRPRWYFRAIIPGSPKPKPPAARSSKS
jgi:hypothetical protein